MNTSEELLRVATRLLRGLYPLPPVRTLGIRVSHVYYREVRPVPGKLVQKKLKEGEDAPQIKARKRKPVVEEDLFQSIMSHSILPNKKLAPGALLQKHKCPVCNQQ